MKPITFSRFDLIFLCMILLNWFSVAAQEMYPIPKTYRSEVTDTIHGIVITDPYRWLEDQNSTETRDWINAQNKYSDHFLKNLPYRESIRIRMEQLYRIEKISIPFERGG